MQEVWLPVQRPSVVPMPKTQGRESKKKEAKVKRKESERKGLKEKRKNQQTYKG